jgi:hypothetical protein
MEWGVLLIRRATEGGHNGQFYLELCKVIISIPKLCGRKSNPLGSGTELYFVLIYMRNQFQVFAHLLN